MPGVNLKVNVFNGARKPISGGLDLLVTIRDGFQKQLVRDFFKGPTINFSVPFNNNLADNYTVIVAAKGHVQAGFSPVKISDRLPNVLNLMLLPKKASYDFTEAGWTKIQASHGQLCRILSGDLSEMKCRERYEKLMADEPHTLACILNVTTALKDVHFPNGTALEYMKRIKFDEKRTGQDRFFVYADESIVEEVEVGARQGKFDPQPGVDINHPGATSSYKENQFGEANIQFSFHTNDTKTIEERDGDGEKRELDCIKVELDMDYFADPLAHALLEVIPNRLSRGRTDPRKVYFLRWMAGKHAGVPQFNPPYIIA